MYDIQPECRENVQDRIKELQYAFSDAALAVKKWAEKIKPHEMPEEKQPERKYAEVRALEIGGAIFTNIPSLPPGLDQAQDLGVTVRRVPREMLGYNVLGRAFTGAKLVEIADDLRDDEFEEVRLHELLHVQDPGAHEYDIRARTRALAGFRTKFD